MCTYRLVLMFVRTVTLVTRIMAQWEVLRIFVCRLTLSYI